MLLTHPKCNFAIMISNNYLTTQNYLSSVRSWTMDNGE